jgi:hypothetical protein
MIKIVLISPFHSHRQANRMFFGCSGLAGASAAPAVAAQGMSDTGFEFREGHSRNVLPDLREVK